MNKNVDSDHIDNPSVASEDIKEVSEKFKPITGNRFGFLMV